MRYEEDGDTDFQLGMILNEGLNLSDNFRGGMLEYTTTGALQEIQHGLGFTPSGYHILYKAAVVDIFGGDLSTWNNESIFMNSDVTSVLVRLYVL